MVTRGSYVRYADWCSAFHSWKQKEDYRKDPQGFYILNTLEEIPPIMNIQGKLNLPPYLTPDARDLIKWDFLDFSTTHSLAYLLFPIEKLYQWPEKSVWISLYVCLHDHLTLWIPGSCWRDKYLRGWAVASQMQTPSRHTPSSRYWYNSISDIDGCHCNK